MLFSCFILLLLGLWLANYKPKLTDETVILNYLSLTGGKKRAIYEAARNVSL